MCKVEGARRGIVGAGNIGECVAAAGEGQAYGLAIIGENGPEMEVCQAVSIALAQARASALEPTRVDLNVGEDCYDNTNLPLSVIAKTAFATSLEQLSVSRFDHWRCLYGQLRVRYGRMFRGRL